MRQITKDIQINMDGNRIGFRLSKLDAFSGVMLLRLLMRLEDHQKCHPEQAAAQAKDLTMLDLIASLSEEELRSVMTSVLNHVSVLLPAGPQPVMTGSEWGYPELEHDTPSCMKCWRALPGVFPVFSAKADRGRRPAARIHPPDLPEH